MACQARSRLALDELEAAEELLEKIEGVAESAKIGEPTAQACVPVSVVGSTPLLIAEHLVGLGTLLESALSFGVSRVPVRVIFHGQPPVRLLEFRFRRVPGNAEDLVIVPF